MSKVKWLLGKVVGLLGLGSLRPLVLLIARGIVQAWRLLLRPLLRVSLVPVVLAAVVGVVWALNLPDVEALKRDLRIANIAHRRAGSLVPFDPDFTDSAIYDPTSTWGMKTNSKWLLRWTLRIVPMFGYEGLAGTPRYPSWVIFAPLSGARSLLVGGTVVSMTPPIAVLNERLFNEPLWDDEPSAMGVLVHELIHVQGGNFVKPPSEFLESHTSAATTEILAGMCEYGEEVACKAFWGDIEGYARADLAWRLRSYKLMWLYELYADLKWRDAVKERQAEKIDRFWEGSEQERYAIVYRYSIVPWSDMVLPGVCNDYSRLNTGLYGTRNGYVFAVLGLEFDDTRALLQPWLRDLCR